MSSSSLISAVISGSRPPRRPAAFYCPGLIWLMELSRKLPDRIFMSSAHRFQRNRWHPCLSCLTCLHYNYIAEIKLFIRKAWYRKTDEKAKLSIHIFKKKKKKIEEKISGHQFRVNSYTVYCALFNCLNSVLCHNLKLREFR